MKSDNRKREIVKSEKLKLGRGLKGKREKGKSKKKRAKDSKG